MLFPENTAYNPILEEQDSVLVSVFFTLAHRAGHAKALACATRTNPAAPRILGSGNENLFVDSGSQWAVIRFSAVQTARHADPVLRHADRGHHHGVPVACAHHLTADQALFSSGKSNAG